jgi:dTDP-glucose pyrophosphorylase
MIIVMPMAGRASKFKEAGYALPKPLIEIKGKPMVKWATDSVPFITRHKMVFILLKEHIDQFGLDKKLKEMYPGKITIIEIDRVTGGAACTVLHAKEILNKDEDLIVYNTDQYFRAPVETAIKFRGPEIKGIIPVFQAINPRWSFVKADRHGFVTEAAEKIPISSNATVGLYYFSSGKDFIWAAEEMIRKNIRRSNEFYICPVYNELIAAGQKIKMLESEFMWGLGSPEDVLKFIEYYKDSP